MSKIATSITPRVVNRNRGGSNAVSSTAEKVKKINVQTSPKNSSPKRRSAEDTCFDREMCRFYWGQDYIQDGATGLDREVSGQFFFDVLGKLRRIVKHISGISTLTDEVGNVIEGFQLQSLYQRSPNTEESSQSESGQTGRHCFGRNS